MTTLRRVATWAALTTCATLAVAPNAFAVTKTFAVDVAPDVAPASKSIVYTAKISNTLAPQSQRLGSVNLTVPSEWRVLSATRGTVSGNVVQLRDLDLAPGKSVDVGVLVDTSGVAGTWEWTARGKQANDFNGDGNDFAADPIRTDLTAEIETSGAHDVQCPEEPTSVGDDTTCKTQITWRGTGPLNDDGTPVPNDTLGTAGGTAPATGAETQRAAASAAATNVVQTSFQVTVSVLATPALAANAGTLTLRLPAAQTNCEGNAETSPVTALANGPLNRAKTIVFSTDAGIPLAGPSQGMCFGGPVPFATNPSAPVPTAGLYNGSVFFFGTLADCADGSATSNLRLATPCTSFRGNDGGNNTTVVRVPATYPDPTYRG